MRPLATLAFLLSLASPAPAGIQLVLHYEALQRILAAQVFTQDGRSYVKGGQSDRCSYAYLENPLIGAEKARLRIKARFSGRSAVDLLGRCIGLGDSFDLTILATPFYTNGSIAFREVDVSSNGRDGVYIRGVRRSLARSLERDFYYPLREETRKLLEERRSDLYDQQVMNFDVTGIHVAPYALVLLVEFGLAVK
jgi:hypothetical protein